MLMLTVILAGVAAFLVIEHQNNAIERLQKARARAQRSRRGREAR